MKWVLFTVFALVAVAILQGCDWLQDPKANGPCQVYPERFKDTQVCKQYLEGIKP